MSREVEVKKRDQLITEQDIKIKQLIAQQKDDHEIIEQQR